jgi:O-antigen/teichoic acid export membrane protein
VPGESARGAPVGEDTGTLLRRGVSAWRHAASLVRLRPFDTDTPDGRSKERYRRIALTTLSSLVARGLGAIVGLITVPLLLDYLGKERYGLWSAITTLVAWATLFDCGIANGLVNCIARAHGREDREEAGRQVSTALALLLGIAVVLGVAVVLGTPLVRWSDLLSAGGVADEATVRGAVIAALGTLVVGVPLSAVPQIYSGYQKAYVTNAFFLVGTIAGLLALLLALRAGMGMSTLVASFGLASILSSALGLVYAFASMPWLRFRISRVSRDAARALTSRSFPIFLFQIGALAVNETQVIILARRTSLDLVAEYAILMRLYILAMGVIQVSTVSFVPSFREAHERADHAWLRASFRTFVRTRLLLASGAALVLLLMGNRILEAWLGRTDVAFDLRVWLGLAVTMIAVTFATAHSDLLSIMDRLWIPVALVVLNGAVTIALTYWLAPRIGMLGVVVAFGAVAVSLYSWIVPVLAHVLVLRSR